jgi:N6-L-threonylcarbamoyladenine synthase
VAAVLGIDTSAYTTSLALVDESGQVLEDARSVLEVKPGARGMRQSEALFAHTRNLPALFAGLQESLRSHHLVAVAVSTRPRNTTGSYMPVFLAGECVGRSLASVTGVPLFTCSHQEGHVMAGAWGCPGLPDRYLAVHFSGGTSEVLLVEPGREHFYDITVVAATSDLHAGQLVDRVGVRMGLPFPSGPALEALARAAGDAPDREVYLPAAVQGASFSFSGAETRARQLLEAGARREAVAMAVLRCIANTLERVLREQRSVHGVDDVLLVGGVMANAWIRERLQRVWAGPQGVRLHSASPRLSTDNAVGVAWLGLSRWRQHIAERGMKP